MAKRYEVYKCSVCGNIVEVMVGGAGTLVCCDKEMELLKENTVDAAREKHVPEIEKVEGGFKIKIGSVPHPMEEDHYIQWIEVIADDEVYIKFLEPHDDPSWLFETKAESISAREHCNKHGLWKSEYRWLPTT